jgi:hypothetical protein
MNARSTSAQPTTARSLPSITVAPASNVSPSCAGRDTFAPNHGCTTPVPAVTVASAGTTSPASTKISSPGRRSALRPAATSSPTTRRQGPSTAASSASRSESIGRRARRRRYVPSVAPSKMTLVNVAASVARASPSRNVPHATPAAAMGLTASASGWISARSRPPVAPSVTNASVATAHSTTRAVSTAGAEPATPSPRANKAPSAARSRRSPLAPCGPSGSVTTTGG